MFGYNQSRYSPFADPYSNYYASPYAQMQARARAEEDLRARARARAIQQQLRDRYLIPEYEEDRNSSDEEYSSYGAGEYTPYGYVPGYGAHGLMPWERAQLQTKYQDKKKAALLKRKAMEEEYERRHRDALVAEESERSISESSLPQRRTVPVRLPSPEPQPHLPSPPQSRQSSPSPNTSASSPSGMLSLTSEVQNQAASIIQQAYRSHRALRSVRSIQDQFEQLKLNFQRPELLDFQGPSGEVFSVSTLERPSSLPDIPPKLAYTSNNVPLHGYVESLSRLLVALDAIESHGRKDIREKRKDAVRCIEKEATDVEQWWRSVWEGQGVDARDAMCVDPPNGGILASPESDDSDDVEVAESLLPHLRSQCVESSAPLPQEPAINRALESAPSS